MSKDENQCERWLNSTLLNYGLENRDPPLSMSLLFLLDYWGLSFLIACEKQPRIPCVSPRLSPATPPPEGVSGGRHRLMQGIRGCFSQATFLREGEKINSKLLDFSNTQTFLYGFGQSLLTIPLLK
jgi:hypothetical protein